MNLPNKQRASSGADVRGALVQAYKTDGYVLLRHAVEREDAIAFGTTLRRLVDQLRVDSGGILYQHYGTSIRIVNVIGADPAFVGLIDHDGVFPVLLDIMGPYLRVVGSEGMIRGFDDRVMLGFHTDGGPSMQPIAIDHGARGLQVKVQIFFSDVDEYDSGNFTLIPRSHGSPTAPSSCREVAEHDAGTSPTLPADSVQIRARAGDALVFPYSLWHAVAPNRSGKVRLSVILRYGQSWHQPFDFDGLDPELTRRLSARRKRLMGVFDDDEAIHPWDRWYSPPRQREIMEDGRA